jgi:pyruvyltransferase
MNAYWYTDNPLSDVGNVGDMLAPIIIEHYMGKRPVFVPSYAKGKLLSCGSIAEFIQDGDTVWGSGLIQAMNLTKKMDVNILAVRGQLTAQRLSETGYEVPKVYGDPASLMPRIYYPMVKRKYKMGYVPHYVEKLEFLSLFGYHGLVFSIIDTPQHFIDTLLSCEQITTSSLHALILADAYGIPCHYLQVTDKIIGGYFKYEDYISGRGSEDKLENVFKEYCQKVCKTE